LRTNPELSLRSQQRVVVTVEESVLKMKMTDLESQEEEHPQTRYLWSLVRLIFKKYRHVEYFTRRTCFSCQIRRTRTRLFTSGP
jgi:hypothetical protein